MIEIVFGKSACGIMKYIGICQLGIGDFILHQRIDVFIRKGILTVVTPAEKGTPSTRRILRKTQK